MARYILKSTCVSIATELSKRSTTLAAILLAMPIVLFVSFTLIWEESKDANKIAMLTHETLMFILPVLPFLFLLSYMLKNGTNFYISLGVSSLGIILATLLVQKYFFQT